MPGAPDAGGRALRWAAAAALLLLLAGSLWLRAWAQRQHYEHPDEGIAVAVAGRVLDDRTLDTNWARSPVEGEFRYDQYNFSAYHLAAAAWLGAGGVEPGPARLASLRWLSALLHALAIAFTARLAWRWGGPGAALVAAALLALSPTLLQDSLYARPEAFVTVLTLAWALLLGRPQAPGAARLASAGALAGLLLATKVSFLPLLPLALGVAWVGRDVRPAAMLGCGAAALAGFALGAPGAVLHPGEYQHGIATLLRQYSGGHLPHGLPQHAMPARFWFGLEYLRHTAGSLVLLLSLAGAWRLLRERQWRAALVAGGVLATLLYFLQTRAFFERNLSHALPLLFVLAGVGASWLAARLTPRPGLQVGVVVALAGLALWVPATVSRALLRDALPGQLAQARQAAEAGFVAAGYALVALEPMQGNTPADRLCGRVALRDIDFGHPYVRAGADRQLQARGFMQRAHLVGPFAALPTSTLHTYHAADIRYHTAAVPWPEDCPVGLVPLPAPATVEPLAEIELRLEGHAARDGHEPGAALPHWPAPLYGTHSGDDAHRGAVLATIRACRDFILPVVSGPTRQASVFRIARRGATGEQVLFEGPLPPMLGSWSGLQVRQLDAGCATYVASVRDDGTGWGTWGALGHPVHPLASPPSQPTVR